MIYSENCISEEDLFNLDQRFIANFIISLSQFNGITEEAEGRSRRSTTDWWEKNE